MKAVIYARKSTESEERQALSLDAQVKEAKKLAESSGLEVVAVYEEAKSAKQPQNRPLFSEMVGRFYKGDYDHIITWKLDRLARNPIDGGTVNWMLQQGVIKAIHTNDRIYNPTDNVLMMMLEFGMANQFILDLSKNVKRGMQAKLEKGGWNHVAPFGYLNNKWEKTIEPDPERADIVRRMFMMRSQGKSFRQIAEYLETMGVKGKRGGIVSKNYIERIMKNPFYIGVIKHGDAIFKGAHKPIVPRAIFDVAQRVNNELGFKKKNKFNFAFNSLFKCNDCDCSWGGTFKKGHIYYRCSKRKGPCSTKTIRAEVLAKEIINLMEVYQVPQQIWMNIMEAHNDMDLIDTEVFLNEQQKLENRIKALHREMSGNMRMRRNEEIDAETFVRERDKIQSEITRCELRRDEISEFHQKTIKEALDWCELAKDLHSSAKSLPDRELPELMKFVGGNFVIKDGKPVIKQLNPVFKHLESVDLKMWSPTRVEVRTFFKVILDSFKLYPIPNFA